MPLLFPSLNDPEFERRFKSGIGRELAQRSGRRLAVARQPLAQQEGGANVGSMRGPVQRGGMLADRAAAQAQQIEALGATLGQEQQRTALEEGQARAQFDRARLAEQAAEVERLRQRFAAAAQGAKLATTLGVKVASDDRKRKKKEGSDA
jgi:hypothetical protein